MIVNLNDSIIDNKLLEEKRISLSMRYDFCLMEMFALVDSKNLNYLNLADFERFCYNNGISLCSADLCTVIDRYDKDRDGTLGFIEFCDIFLPKSVEYRRTMQDRIQRGIHSFYDFTAVTQNCIRDLLRSIVTVEDNFEENKFRLSDGRVLTSDEIFAFLDKWKTGYITQSEFNSKLNEAGVFCSESDAKTLFEQFDKNKDGRITFEEFHSPVKTRKRLF